MTQPNQCVVQHPFPTAETFLDALSPTRPPFYPVELAPWIFRGHGDANYQLLPSSRRQGGELCRKEPRCPPSPTVGHQVIAERIALEMFYQRAERQGVHLPENSMAIRSTLGVHSLPGRETIPVPPSQFEVWPPEEFFPLLGAAQHHGLPTCLLDWTWKARVAAFFAADDCVRLKRRGQQPERFSVWALHIHYLRNSTLDPVVDHWDVPATIGSLAGAAATKVAIYGPGPFSLVSLSGADNDRLRAQAGLFLLHRVSYDRIGDPLPFAPWEDEMARIANHVAPMFRHFTAPSSEAEKVLDLLEAEGISHSTLFPGLVGVAQEVRAIWGLHD
ncbi:MAG: FRG domain-containing protein [Myxococcales bacterium]|nr:FRG domain-containing protein [Myxococcales bacterium]